MGVQYLPRIKVCNKNIAIRKFLAFIMICAIFVTEKPAKINVME